ncbi:HK97 family phage prohead protease [Chryseobacterium sp. G0240]|uniref:HK97 family phage prohead protease n=1 Tax=Chryseobacterium sp. G0240 TaxID=2487066 RepID=UPI000F4471A2|nr:HK97 family phage prohead protease [Chryseobacterium sp. G0240]ROI02934.1 HK97 family phage prohead protease [Chryseobacterium sp. G0240]
MKGILELKNTGTIKDVDAKNRIVTGYLSSFGNVDYDNDIIVKGAFQKSISERLDKIFFLYQHEWSKPLGKFKKLEEDNKGLYFEAEIIETSYGKDQILLYETGLVAEHSIGYQVIKDEWDSTKQIRTIKELKLYEGSAVTLGANSETPFTGFKSQLEQKDAISKIVQLMKSGNLTDDTFIQLELALKMLQAEAYEIGKTENTQSKNEPSADTQLKAYEPLINTLTSFKIN